MASESQPLKGKAKVVDIHTHMYPPEYVKVLESRNIIPLVRKFPGAPDPRLVLLDAEVPLLESAQQGTSVLPGRPLTRHFSSLYQKIHFMDTHHIDISVVSLANPWLDFLPSDQAFPSAKSINASFSSMCAVHPGRLYFFAALPLTAPTPQLLDCISSISSLPYCRGVILGTSGLGSGLDDPAILPIFSALADADLPIFLHPHYGLPNSVFGPRSAAGEYGHVLPLALGFPMETTIAVARMFLAGVFDKVPNLRIILAHSGGTLPFLAGRIESCIMHDGHLVNGMKKGARRTVWEVLSTQVYLDAVVYGEVGLKAAVEASGGSERLMFGTDHPFFPPVGGEEGEEDGEWESVGLNVKAVVKVIGEGEEYEGVMGGNAFSVLRLEGE
ncbi:uracil-5-carboxylate decarboxylase [Immersiella caudata]|uniref:Uracil-5-carboxylate decarboxylase n=1 Tax=Immersiella caudata TaxID=314043 RepID=A0AA40C2Y5_9PEZI|nr:uracil-5-carboxylate decarboxylase [Immersiella caudata]